MVSLGQPCGQFGQPGGQLGSAMWSVWSQLG